MTLSMSYRLDKAERLVDVSRRMSKNVGSMFRTGGKIRRLASALALSAAFSAPISGHPTDDGAPLAEVDFQWEGGHIYVPAQIQGHACSFLLDTGTSANVVDLALADKWGLAGSGTIDVDGSGPAVVHGKYLSKVNAVVGGISVPIAYAAPIDALSNDEGRHLESILGYTFLQSHIVEIDYARRHLKIYGRSAGLSPAGLMMPIKFVDSLPQIQLEMKIGQDTFKLWTMVDSGASDSTLTGRFLRGRKLQIGKTSVVTFGGIGGESVGTLFRPDSVKIGSIEFAKPVVSMAAASAGEYGPHSRYDFTIGSDFLKRFVVTLDYPEKKIFLAPNSEVDKPFEADKTGLLLTSEGESLRTFRVTGIVPGSSAEVAGVTEGDIIETVDGRLASDMSLSQLRELFELPTAPSWTLGIRRNGQVLTLNVNAKSIV